MSASKNTGYKWKRFWCPRDGNLNLGDGGFLVDPDGEYGSALNPDVVSFDKIQGTSCLILLGEPGTGKSHALIEHKESTDKSLSNGDASLWIDLRSFQTDVRLIQGLFEHPTFIAWRNGTHRLHLFLDSFDEGLLRVNVLSTILGDELKKYSGERLLVRVACRTLDWPISLEGRLGEIWGAEQLRVFEIAPLRRLDVIEAARAESVDADKFLEEIWRTESSSLAIKPVTLRFLISLFKKNGNFPPNQANLYEQGCRVLCEETNEDRRETKQTGSLSANQLLTIASRVAAATVLGNRNAVWTNVDLGDVSPEDITIQDLIGETETSKGHTVPVTEAVIRETLATGLFSSRGPHRTGWAHQTYAEFLAARYLLHHQFTEEQIMSLLVHPGDGEGKIVPQLQETAGWVAGSSPAIFRRITATDPQVLLRSDAARVDEKSRAALLDALLKGTENDQLFIEIEQRSDLHKLSHGGIEDQLRPYVVDRSRKERVRDLAIDIARACKARGLQDEVATIALDPTERYELRKHAALFVGQVADKAIRATLKPLTVGSADDVDDDLKGWALRAVWPDSMTPEELFERLSLPKRENYIGGYKGFLGQLEEAITPDMLPVALKWAESHVRNQWDVGTLIDKFLILGFEHIEKPEVLDPYIKLVLKRLRETYAILSYRTGKDFSRRIAEDRAKRRLLIGSLVKTANDPADTSSTMFRINRLIADEDFSWLIDQCTTPDSPELSMAFAKLVHFTFNIHNLQHVDAVIVASETNSALATEFAWLLTSVELNSQQAAGMKQSYEEQQRLSQREEPQPLVPSPTERRATLLQESESGNSNAFIEITGILSVEPDSGRYGDPFATDITDFPGWQSADSSMRVRIIDAARRFARDGDPTWDWLGEDRITYAALAGCRAFRLLVIEDKEFLNTLDPAIWRRWVPAIIGHPFPTRDDGEDAYQELLAMAQKRAPEQVAQAVGLVLEKEDRAHKTIFVLRHFETHWTDDLAAMLMDKVKSGTLSPGGMAVVLGGLMGHHVAEARNVVESRLPLPLPTDPTAREFAESAARLLIEHAGDSGWSVVWPAIQSDAEFGMAVVESTFGGIAYGRVPQLTEDQVADLYIWLVQHYPYGDDRKTDGAISSRDTMGHFRDGLITHLSQRGTYACSAGIEKIIGVFPEFTWLKWHLQRARETARRKTWTPPRIQDLIALAQEQERRFVQNGDQLLQVVIESLQRLDAKLQGETPAAAFLWNEQKDGEYRPKDENEVSDLVKLHLEDDLKRRGIIVNREVQIRQGYKPGTGERTDLHVDGVAFGPNGKVLDIVTVIIETKGCWHAELNSAMETQLKDRYLKDNKCDHGIYLVGWFNCPQWDTSDSRKPPAGTREEARKRFDDQAAALSGDGITIRAFVLNTSLRS